MNEGEFFFQGQNEYFGPFELTVQELTPKVLFFGVQVLVSNSTLDLELIFNSDYVLKLIHIRKYLVLNSKPNIYLLIEFSSCINDNYYWYNHEYYNRTN